MKEYWVNVYAYGNNYQYRRLGNLYSEAYKCRAVARLNRTKDRTVYRLHVREFETKEAKELYLKMKYNIIPKSKWEDGLFA